MPNGHCPFSVSDTSLLKKWLIVISGMMIGHIKHLCIVCCIFADTFQWDIFPTESPSSWWTNRHQLILQRQISCHICDLLKSNFSRTTWGTELQSEMPKDPIFAHQRSQLVSKVLHIFPHRVVSTGSKHTQLDLNSFRRWAQNQKETKSQGQNNGFWRDQTQKPRCPCDNTYQPWTSDWL